MGDDVMRASTFETYLLTDDTRRHPMSSTFRFEFVGEADTAVLRRALDTVTPLHPMLTARPELRRGHWSWTPQTRTLPLDCASLGTPLICPAYFGMDLQSEPGMRFWCRTGDGRTELTMQVHHASTDGVGALQFVFDVLAEYHLHFQAGDTANAKGNGRRKFSREIDAELLPLRDQHDFTPPEPVSLSKNVRVTVAEATKLLIRQPQRLRTKDRSPAPKPPQPQSILPEIHGIHLSPECSEAYREAARTQGVMVNDMFLRDMFVTLVRWAEQCGQPLSDRSWLRLTMPISVRSREQAKMSATNALSYAFLTRRVEATRDPAALLASIHEETEAIKYWRIAGMFLGGVAALQGARLLRPLLRMPTCFSSMVVSNLGDVRHCATARFPRRDGRIVAGNLDLHFVSAAPPPRSKTHGAIVVSRYAGRFSLGIQTDYTIDSDSAKAFLELYASQLTASAQ